MNKTSARVLVVGGGVFGVAAALELRRRDWEVTLLDPGPLPHPRASSTDLSKIVRMDYGTDDVLTDLATLAIDGWERWSQQWSRTLFHQTGFLFLRRSAMESESFEWESFTRVSRRGVELERLNAEAIAERYPAWQLGAHAEGYLSPRGGWAESGAVVEWMLGEARTAGVHVQTGMTVAGLQADGKRVTGIYTRTGEALRADHVVVAAGAWTPILVPWLKDRMHAVGQPVLHFLPDDPERWRAPTFPPWGGDISRTGWYGFPAVADGRVKIGHHGAGFSLHPDSPDEEVPDTVVAHCRAFLAEALPGLANAPVVSRRLCLYCDTFDGDFFIGRDPSREGLTVAAGGSGHGFKFAPVLGPIIADALEGKENPWSYRFQWRAIGPVAHEEARHQGEA